MPSPSNNDPSLSASDSRPRCHCPEMLFRRSALRLYNDPTTSPPKVMESPLFLHQRLLGAKGVFSVLENWQKKKPTPKRFELLLPKEIDF